MATVLRHLRLLKTAAALQLGLVVVCVAFTLLAPKTLAAVGIYKPINYQGKLSSTGGLAIANGVYNMRFKVFNAASGGSPVWVEVWDNTTQRVTSTGGLFSIALGTYTTMTGSVDFNSDSLYLQVEFDPGNDGTYEEVFTPRRRFAAVPYARNADQLDGLDSTQFMRSDTSVTASGTITIRPRDSRKIGIDIVSQGGSSATGAIRLSTQGGPHIVFGSGGLNYDTNLYRVSANTLKTDDTFQVVGTLSGSSLVVSGSAAVSGSLVVNRTISGAALEVLGTASGADLYATRSITGTHLYAATTFGGAGLADCDTAGTSKLLWDSGTKRFSCGTDQTGAGGANWSGTGALQTAFDARYVNVSGDTMTGGLRITKSNGYYTGALLSVLGTVSGAHLFGQKGVSSSGTLAVEQRIAIGSGAFVLEQFANSTGAYLKNRGRSVPVLVLENSSGSVTGAGKAAHILFGYNGTFDVALFRSSGAILNLSGHLLPALTNTFDLGSSTRRFRDLYLSGGTISLGAAGDETTIRYNTAADRFSIDAGNNGTPELSILSTGNVGLGGEMNPETTLEVAGTISGAFIFARGSLSTSGSLSVKGAARFQGNVTLAGTGQFLLGSAALSGSVARTVTTVDSDGNVGGFSSLAIAPDGLPIVAHFDVSNNKIKILKCGNAACSGGNSSVTKDTASTLSSPSLAIGSDGLGVISFDASGLRVMKCTDATCSTSVTTTLDASATSPFSSIAIAPDGLPVISYYDYTNKYLKVAKCGNSSCTSGNVTTSVDTSNLGSLLVGGSTSIGIGLDGLPVIAYFDDTNDDLKVAKCGNGACSAGNTLTTVDGAGSVGLYASLAVPSDGLPVIAYYDNTNGDLKVAKCGNAACSAGNTLTTVDSDNVGAYYPSVAIAPDGLPVISYHDNASSDLKVAKCGNAACSAGNSVSTISATDGRYTSVAIAPDGLPVISAYDFSNTNLVLVRCADATCGKSSASAYTGGQRLGAPRGNERSYAPVLEGLSVVGIGNPSLFRSLTFSVGGMTRMSLSPRGVLTLTGAAVLRTSGTATGMVLSTSGTGAPLLVLSAGTGSGSAHIVFGQSGTYDVRLWRSAAAALTTNASLTVERPEDSAFLTLQDTTNNDSISIRTGSGAPGGVVSAQLGSLYTDHATGRVYVNRNGGNQWAELATSTGAHMARMVRAAAQSISAAGATKIQFDTETYDIGGIADSVTNDRFNIQRSGYYFVTATYFADVNDAGEFQGIYVYKNGVNVYQSVQLTSSTNTQLTNVASDTMYLVAGDYLEMYVYSSDAFTTRTSDDLMPRMSVTEVEGYSGGAAGPWTNGGSVSYLTDTAQNVAIGSTTAETKLEVFGTVSGSSLYARQNLLSSGALAVDGHSVLNRTLAVKEFAGATATTVCRTGTGVLAACSSSLRYKEDVEDLGMGLDIIRRMRPVNFKWKGRDERDFGFVAEEMQAIDPLLVEYDGQGNVQGVKYMQLTAILANAVKSLDARVEHLALGEGASPTRVPLTITGAMHVPAEADGLKRIDERILASLAAYDVPARTERAAAEWLSGSGGQSLLRTFIDERVSGSESSRTGTGSTDARLTRVEALVWALTRSSDATGSGAASELDGDVSLSGALLVHSDATFHGRVTVAGSAAFGSGLTLVGPLQLGSGATLRAGTGVLLGSILVDGAVVIRGPVTVEGLADFLGPVRVRGELTVSSRQAGYARIARYTRAVTVRFDTGFLATPVVTAAPTGFVRGAWRVSPATRTGFVIELADAAVEEVDFSWLALATDSPVIHGAADGATALPFPVDTAGRPFSATDAVWTACVREPTSYDLCTGYHQDSLWFFHPDLARDGDEPTAFRYDAHTGELTPPAGFVPVNIEGSAVPHVEADDEQPEGDDAGGVDAEHEPLDGVLSPEESPLRLDVLDGGLPSVESATGDTLWMPAASP